MGWHLVPVTEKVTHLPLFLTIKTRGGCVQLLLEASFHRGIFCPLVLIINTPPSPHYIVVVCYMENRPGKAQLWLCKPIRQVDMKPPPQAAPGASPPHWQLFTLSTRDNTRADGVLGLISSSKVSWAERCQRDREEWQARWILNE